MATTTVQNLNKLTKYKVKPTRERGPNRSSMKQQNRSILRKLASQPKKGR